MDPYKVLDVGPEASPDELKARHRKLVRRHHPDRFETGSAEATEAEQRVAEVNAAYRLLTHPDEMAEHERSARHRRAATGVRPVGPDDEPVERRRRPRSERRRWLR